MNIKNLLILCILTFGNLHALLDEEVKHQHHHRRRYVYNGATAALPVLRVPSRDCGMFSLFFSVVDGLYQFETGRIDSVVVDFEDHGLYYDSRHGKNWWEYYCEPIHTNKEDRSLFKDKKARYWGQDSYFPRMVAYQIANKYMKPKAHIQAKIDAFCDKNFSNKYVIGLHYRGTDKSSEAPRVAYEDAATQINAMLEVNLPIEHTKIFIATDEAAFLEYAIENWGDAVCYNDSTRSTGNNAVHTDANRDAYKVGEDAILDMLILSRCNVLVRCRSNLSLWSGFYSPLMPIVDLNKHFGE